MKPSVAVVGRSGVGKSSLINEFAGGYVTDVGDIDTTKKIWKVFESTSTEFWDVPGQSDTYAIANLKRILQIKAMHLILIVYTDRVEHVINLEKMVKACKVPHIVVRNKIDQIYGAGEK